MIPYLHLGPLQLPTFGLMVALALITAAYALQADFDRRGMNADAFTMITVAGLMGIFGAKLYHLLEPQSRKEFFRSADPSEREHTLPGQPIPGNWPQNRRYDRQGSADSQSFRIARRSFGAEQHNRVCAGEPAGESRETGLFAN